MVHASMAQSCDASAHTCRPLRDDDRIRPAGRADNRRPAPQAARGRGWRAPRPRLALITHDPARRGCRPAGRSNGAQMTTPAGDPPRIATTAAQGGQDDTSGPHYLSHRQIVVVLFGVMAGMLLAALDQGIVGTALPRIVSELGGLDRLSWVVTAYLLTSTASTPLWGK